MPARSSIHNGWHWDAGNSRLDFYYRGTRIGHINASGFTVASGTVTLPAGSIGAADIADDSLIGDQVANVADVNTEGGIPLLYRIDVAALGASTIAESTDITVVDKIRVLDVWAIHTGGNGVATDNIQVLSTGATITDAMSWSGADKIIVRAAEIDDAQHEIAAGNILRVTLDTSATDAASGAGTVYVSAIKVA